MTAQNISDKVPTYGPAVPPIGMLWSALRAADEPIDLEFLAGISGATFRTCFDEEGNDDVLWLEGEKAADNALPILGYELHPITSCFSHHQPLTDKIRADAFLQVQASLDAGTPVLLTGSFGWALLLGYDKAKQQYCVRQASPWNAIHDMTRCPPWEAGKEQEERWEDEDKLAAANGGIDLAVLRKRGKSLPKRGLAINALRHAIPHAKDKSKGTKHFGLSALEFFSKRLEQEAKEAAWDAQIYGAALPMQIIFLALNRALGVSFLKEIVGEFGAQKGALLQECIPIYEEAAHEWLMLQSSLHNPQAYYENKDSVKKDPTVLQLMADSLKKICEIERRAITMLESVV